MNPDYRVQHGDILLTNCEPSVGAEIKKIRPCVVIQSERLNRMSSLLTVIPITSQVEKPFFADIVIPRDEHNHLNGDALVRTSQIFTYDRSRFLKLIGRCSPPILRQIKEQLMVNFQLTT